MDFFAGNKKPVIKSVVLLVAVLFSACSGKPFNVKTISGGKSGERNFSVAADLSEIINRNTESTRIKLTLDVTEDKFSAVQAMLEDKIDFVIINAKDEYDISKGYGKWGSLEHADKLRAMFGLHFDMITFAASGISGIYSFPSIREKTAGIGPRGSELQLHARDIIAAYNLTLDDFETSDDPLETAARQFREGNLDAFFCQESHPSALISELSGGRIPVNIIGLSEESIAKLVASYPYYARTEVPVDFYPNIEKCGPVYTVGIRNVLITSRNIDDRTAYAIAREVFENFDKFKALDKCYRNISKESMLAAFSLRIHEGADKYYEETGLTRYIQNK